MTAYYAGVKGPNGGSPWGHPSASEGRITATEVMKVVGCSAGKDGRKDFKRSVRDNPNFQDALAEAGFEEVRQGRGGQVWFVRSAAEEALSIASE